MNLLFYYMTDEPFLRFMDMFWKSRFMHSHLFCKLSGINFPWMIL